jgi:hypothetical protein
MIDIDVFYRASMLACHRDIFLACYKEIFLACYREILLALRISSLNPMGKQRDK